MKAHIRRWVNEKHNVITAEDMTTALESHGGVKGVRAAVVKVDTNKEITANKIPGRLACIQRWTRQILIIQSG